MPRLREILFRLQPLFRKRKIEAGLSEEIQAHLDMAIEANLAAGMTPEAARYAALREFGGVEQIKERYRDERGIPWIEDLIRDIGFAFRQLRKTPGFTAVVVLSLSLGIGANTTVFSLMNDVLLRRLPVRNPDELLLFQWVASSTRRMWRGWTLTVPGTKNQTATVFTERMFERFRAREDTLAEVVAFASLARPAKLTVDRETEIVPMGHVVSGGYFGLLGVAPRLGRLIAPDDDAPAATPVVVLSHACWQRRFGGDPSVLGRTATVNAVPCAVIGVAAPEFRGTAQIGEAPELFFPLAMKARLEPTDGAVMEGRGFYSWLNILARA